MFCGSDQQSIDRGRPAGVLHLKIGLKRDNTLKRFSIGPARIGVRQIMRKIGTDDKPRFVVTPEPFNDFGNRLSRCISNSAMDDSNSMSRS